MSEGWKLAIDASVLGIYFCGIVAIGLYAGRKNTNLTDFALGSRSIPWWAVLASIVAAETSAATFLGTPAEGFKYRSYVYGQLVVGTVLARVIIAFTFIRPYYQYRVQSIYEFLTVRFGPGTKNMASGIFLFTRVLGIGVRLYLGGAIMVVIWRYLLPDIPITLWTYFYGIVFVTVLTTIYTAVGGIKAVIWTDLIQASLMLASVALAIGLLYYSLPGGFAQIGELVGGWNQITVFQTGFPSHSAVPGGFSWGESLRIMFEEAYTIPAALVASTMLTMATHGTDQDMVQRMLTAPDYRKSQFSLILSGLADIPIVASFLTVGVLLYAHFQANPDPMLPAAHNEIFAYYIVHEMPVVARGLIVAGIFATMMGSTSAALNALATSFTRDFYLPYFNKSADERESVSAARWATSIFGILMIAVATFAASAVLADSTLTIIPIAIGILGYTYGALLAMFLMGMLTRNRGRDFTNMIAMGVGIISVLVLARIEIPGIPGGSWILDRAVRHADGSLEHVTGYLNFGWFLPDWWPKFAWPWYICIGCIVTLAIAILFKTPDAQIEAARRHVEGN